MKTRETLPAEINGFDLVETGDLCPECWGEVFSYEGERICIDCLEYLPNGDETNDE